MTVARWYLLHIIAAFLPYLVDTFSIKNARQPWCYLIYDQVFDVKTNSIIEISVELKRFQVQLKQNNFLTLKWWQVLDTKTKETTKKSFTTWEKNSSLLTLKRCWCQQNAYLVCTKSNIQNNRSVWFHLTEMHEGLYGIKRIIKDWKYFIYWCFVSVSLLYTYIPFESEKHGSRFELI